LGHNLTLHAEEKDRKTGLKEDCRSNDDDGDVTWRLIVTR
jgi:hypothetical protein